MALYRWAAGLPATVALILGIVVACTSSRPSVDVDAPGDPDAGAAAMEELGCAACHTIPGIRGADAHVGPPLTDWARRRFIAGTVSNTPENLARWIAGPQDIRPGTAMPDVGATDEDARDIAAYLFTVGD